MRVVWMTIGIIVFVAVLFFVATIISYETGCQGEKYFQKPECQLVKSLLNK